MLAGKVNTWELAGRLKLNSSNRGPRVLQGRTAEFLSRGVAWTSAIALPIMKVFKHLGEANRVPLEPKATINLPKTAFPMKANLPQNEPKMLARWEEARIYERIREARKGSPTYILHDGPPYTSGPIHMGTALNKCLKDFIVKSKTMAGFDAP